MAIDISSNNVLDLLVLLVARYLNLRENCCKKKEKKIVAIAFEEWVKS